MKITALSGSASVQDVATYGDDATIYRVAKVCTGYGFEATPKDDESLARFVYQLAKRKHERCFEFAGIVFGIRCPIYVERQLRTYRKPELERSLRYCAPIEAVERVPLTEYQSSALSRYNARIANGEKRERARKVLPLDSLTETVALYSLRCLFHVFDERLAPPAQAETSEIVAAMYEIAKAKFPATIAAYDETRKVVKQL